MRYQNETFYRPPFYSNPPVKRGTRFSPPEVFEVKVTPSSNPEKVAGSIAKALLDGKEVIAEVSGEAAMARLLMALGLAQDFTVKNGGEMRVSVPEVDLRRETVKVRVTARPLQVR